MVTRIVSPVHQVGSTLLTKLMVYRASCAPQADMKTHRHALIVQQESTRQRPVKLSASNVFLGSTAIKWANKHARLAREVGSATKQRRPPVLNARLVQERQLKRVCAVPNVCLVKQVPYANPARMASIGVATIRRASVSTARLDCTVMI